MRQRHRSPEPHAVPKILLCDEPTSMQDAQRAAMVDVGKYATSGTATIFVTHDLPLAGNAAERIMVMKEDACARKGALNILNFLKIPIL